MAITQDELQSIINAVLSAIRTNSMTIDQLTPVTSLSESDAFEIGGGKKVTYKVLRDLIMSLSSNDQDSLSVSISKCELKSASISTTESTATLSISSVGKTITSSIPIATVSKAGLMSAADKLKLESAYSTSGIANTTANDAKNRVIAIEDMLGSVNGIATLDSDGMIPEVYIPASFDNVKAFDGFLVQFSVQGIQMAAGSAGFEAEILYEPMSGRFIARQGNKHYATWPGADSYGALDAGKGRIPNAGKIYVDRTGGRSYFWDGAQLVMLSPELGIEENMAFPGDEGARLAEQLESIQEAQESKDREIDNLKSSLDKVKEFDGFFDDGNIHINTYGTAPKSSEILYNKGEFIAEYEDEYFAKWDGWESYGTITSSFGITPVEGKIYVDKSTNISYRCDGRKLAILGRDIGHTSSTAYPGNEGKELSERLERLSSEFDGLNFVAFAGFIEDAVSVNTTDLYYSRSIKKFIVVQKYFSNPEAGQLPTAEGSVNYITIDNGDALDYSNKMFRYGNRLYKYTGSDLEEYSPDLTDLYSRISNLVNINFGTAVVNVNNLVDDMDEMSLKLAVETIAEHDEYAKRLGLIIIFYGEDGKWQAWQYQGNPNSGDDELPMGSINSWEKFGGSSVGNCLNVTVEIPKTNTTNPYYDLASAIATVFAKDRAKLGLQITFAATATTWKQYQYIGSTLGKGDFCNESNWIDMAGTSAGKEPILNVNNICGEPTAAEYYDLMSAVNAIGELEKSTKITYRKPGMIITYKVGDKQWETKQLGDLGDFGKVGGWKDYGGGSKIEAKDEPEKDGQDAFSTGGAYTHIPVGREVIETEGKVTVNLFNAGGEPIFDPIEFNVGTGSGSSGGTIISVKIKDNPLSAAFGSTIATKAAIRSVTTSGKVEVENTITSIEIIDRDTNVSVWSKEVNQASSGDMDDYTFDLDFTQFFNEAGKKKYTILITDELGTTTTKFLTVRAEDLTVSVDTVQMLNVNPDAMITPATERISVEMFEFKNYQCEKGINTLVEIYLNGQWQKLQEIVVTDSLSRAVTIKPKELGLTHGAYPIRIAGTSLDSGVKGNTVYTCIFVVDAEDTSPLVGIRYNDVNNGQVKLYEALSFDVAVYNPSGADTIVNTRLSNSLLAQVLTNNTKYVSITKQVTGFVSGDELSLYAKIVNTNGDNREYKSYEIPITINGSVIDATLKEGALYAMDFSARTNAEADHSITSGDYRLDVHGSNWRTNGFTNYLGQNSLRIAENVTAELNHAPFAASVLEASGMAWQCQFATNNIKDAKANLLECYDPASGAGFYIRGNKVGIYCRNGVRQREEVGIPCGKQITMSVVVEPASRYVERAGIRYSSIRLYLNGDLVRYIGYVPNAGNLFNSRNITMDGTKGDLYLYHIMAYQTHYEWNQAWSNYLVKLFDTDMMIKEFNFENVLQSQTAEGSTALRPSAAALWARGIPYVVFVASDETFNKFDNGTSTSDNFEMTVYYYNPIMPWRSFKAIWRRVRRQGTTSAKRSKKNSRIYLTICGVDYEIELIPLFPDYVGETAWEREDIETTKKLFKMGYVRVGKNSIPVNIITIKIDYSNSGGANDCSVCDMANATYRALGNDYMTPAQRFFDGTWESPDGSVKLTGLEMNHSTANHPIAVFRSTSDTLQNVYFEAKGNWKEDKAEQTALGFMNTPGYNLGCINYQTGGYAEYKYAEGDTISQTETKFRADSSVNQSTLKPIRLKGAKKDEQGNITGYEYKYARYRLGQWFITADESFTEYYGKPGETLDKTESRFRADSTVNTGKLYMLSEYCGNRYRFMRYKDGAWVNSTGRMYQAGGKGTRTWTVEGDVLNPVYGNELLTYKQLCGWHGVSELADMMRTGHGMMSSWVQKLIDKGKVTADQVPYWTYFFECMIESDDLALAFASGKKVPFELFRFLRYADKCDKEKHPDTYVNDWRNHSFKYLNVRSYMVYYGLTDYRSLYDQQSKNMQPMWFLEDGCRVEYGVYINDKGEADTCDEAGFLRSPSSLIMYLNKVYDADGADGADNDGGNDGDPECDPGKPTDEETGYENPYAGWDSSLWVNLRDTQEMIVDSPGNKTDLRTIVAAMRNVPATVDGMKLNPFSPEGHTYFSLTKRLLTWPKLVSTYDGLRKYVQYTATADAIYFYALQGLGLTSLPDFIEKRWRIRDGYYQTGAFFTNYISFRVACPADAKIRITAAKTGYFGIGNDNTGAVSERVYLEAGQSYEYSNFSHESGALIYLYQADRISEIDLSEMSISTSDGVLDLTVMTLAEKIILGSDTHTERPTSYKPISAVTLGNLPFLESLDIRNTGIKTLDGSGCPRLRHFDGTDSQLQDLIVAETSPINDICLPQTMTDIKIVGLPMLTYTGVESLDGLHITALANVQKLRVESSAKIDVVMLMQNIVRSVGSALAAVRVNDQYMKGDGGELLDMMAKGVRGMNENGDANVGKPVIIGEYELTRLLDKSDIDLIESGVEGITITLVLEAFVDEIDNINLDWYSGDPEVPKLTLGNISDQFLYYNGEAYDDWLEREEESNQSIHNIINE